MNSVWLLLPLIFERKHRSFVENFTTNLHCSIDLIALIWIHLNLSSFPQQNSIGEQYTKWGNAIELCTNFYAWFPAYCSKEAYEIYDFIHFLNITVIYFDLLSAFFSYETIIYFVLFSFSFNLFTFSSPRRAFILETATTLWFAWKATTSRQGKESQHSISIRDQKQTRIFFWETEKTSKNFGNPIEKMNRKYLASFDALGGIKKR